jgi:hypothetical protein
MARAFRDNLPDFRQGACHNPTIESGLPQLAGNISLGVRSTHFTNSVPEAVLQEDASNDAHGCQTSHQPGKLLWFIGIIINL